MTTSAPAGFEFDPYALAVQDDPYPFYTVLREHFPVYWSEKGNCWALSRYDDIAAACNDPTRFSSQRGNVLDDEPARMGRTLGTTDPPKHDNLRALVNAAFMRNRLLEREAQLRALIIECIDEFVGKGGGDLVGDLSSRIAATTVLSVLGFDRGDHLQIKRWVEGVIYRDPVTKTIGPEGIAARQALADYTARTIAERRAQPRDDLISALIEAEVEGNKLTAEDLLRTVSTLIAAGTESFSSFVGNALNALLEYPEQWTLMAADKSRIAGAVEELLRWDTPTQRFHRVAVKDIELHGQVIRAGQSVLVMYGSGNRDERKFERADVLDVTRPVGRHLAFGNGTHFCLGSQLARQMGRGFFEEWFPRVKECSVDRASARRMHSPTFRNYTYFPVSVR